MGQAWPAYHPKHRMSSTLIPESQGREAHVLSGITPIRGVELRVALDRLGHRDGVVDIDESPEGDR